MKKTNRFNLTIICLTIIIFSSSCLNNQRGKNDKAHDDIALSSINRNDTNNFKFIKNYRIKATPLIDSTNFNNFPLKGGLSRNQIELLELTKVDTNKNASFYINYRLNLSKDFYTLVITYYPDENDLFTALINYTKTFEIIDFKDIAFDEIAESCLRTESQIDSMYIEINEYNYCPDMFNFPEKKTTKYIIENNGKINASH